MEPILSQVLCFDTVGIHSIEEEEDLINNLSANELINMFIGDFPGRFYIILWLNKTFTLIIYESFDIGFWTGSKMDFIHRSSLVIY